VLEINIAGELNENRGNSMGGARLDETGNVFYGTGTSSKLTTE